MARDYGKKPSTRHRGNVSKRLLVVLMSFLCGYLTASIFDFTSLSNWVNTQILAQHAPTVAKKPVPQLAQLPKPKFEFYTLLASEHNNPPVQAAKATSASAPPPVNRVANILAAKNTAESAPQASVVAGKPVPPPAGGGKESYLVQVAAFKSLQEAERMKAALVLKGFLVNIATVSQQKTNWYRVSIGPFASRMQALKAQVAVARSEHIVGMIRRMDA